MAEVVVVSEINKTVIELEFTDDDDEDFFLPKQNTLIKPVTNQGSGGFDKPKAISGLSVRNRNTLMKNNNVPDAKNSWKWLMNRMQQNQRNELTSGSMAGSSRGRKRNLKTAPSGDEAKRTKLGNENDDDPRHYAHPLVTQVLPAKSGLPASASTSASSAKFVNSVTDTEPLKSCPSSINTVPQNKATTTRCYPITSGFAKNAPLKTIPSFVSPPSEPSIPSYCSSFNHDDQDYSNASGWESSQPEIIELNETMNENGKQGRISKRACPFYKKIPGTRFAVDAFNYGVIPDIDVYFLSHFHSDHYIGLSKSFYKTLICDAGTGNLVRMKLNVDEKCIRRLELNRVYSIQGVKVVLMSANHCPGSVMFILRLPDGTTILHTGDFRFTPQMLLNPFLQSLSVDCLYLDTTYCDVKYNFPPQKTTISQVVEFVTDYVTRIPQTLFVCGAYCIGKERVFFSVAEALGTKVFCESEKRRMLGAFENSKYDFYLSSTETSAQVHVVPIRNLHVQFLAEYLAHRKNVYTHLIAIKPSGWEFSSKSNNANGGGGQTFTSRSFNGNTITIIGLPYSEHSSYSELEEFVRAIKPKRVQPTVGVGSEGKRKQMTSYISSWLT